MSTRYDRQIPLIGKDGQEKLAHAKVGVAGCGGLGTTLVTNLASAGVGTLVIADGDVPEITNLNRQFVYREDSDDRKAELLAQWAMEVNPDVCAIPFTERLDDDNIGAVFGDCDVIVDCLDRISTRMVVNRFAVSSGKTLVHGGVSGYTGQVTVVVPGETPCLECLYGDVKDAPAGTVTPSIGAMVTNIASMEAVQVLQLLTGTGSPLAGRMLSINMCCPETEIYEVCRRDSCRVCGRRARL